MSAPRCASGFELRTIPGNKMEPLDKSNVTLSNLLNPDGSLSLCVAPCDDRTIPRLSLPESDLGLYANPLNTFNPSFGYKCMSSPIMNYDSNKVTDVLAQFTYGSVKDGKPGIPSSMTCNKGLLNSYSINGHPETTCVYNASAYPLRMPK
jgi:hypothetical protein